MRPSTSLRKFVAPEFIVGAGARRLVGQYAKRLGASRVFVVSDQRVAEAGWLEQVLAEIEAAQLPCSVYTEVSSNPRLEQMLEGSARYLRGGCNLLVAVGGGSVIDCAKGIGLASTSTRALLELVGVDEVTEPMPPLICVPTTLSASDVSQFMLVAQHEARRKPAVVSKAIVPDLSLSDPDCLATLDRRTLAATMLDCVAHAFEAYASTAQSPMTDLFALESVRRIGPVFEGLRRTELTSSERETLMLSGLYAGLAFSNASLGLGHALAHAVEAHADNLHGDSLAVLLPHVVRFNYEARAERYDCLGEALGLERSTAEGRTGTDADGCGRLLERLSNLRSLAESPTSLAQLKVLRADLPSLVAHASADVCIATNPRLPTRTDIQGLYERAL